MNELLKNKKTISYAGLIFVVLVWGTGPLTSKYFLDYYSPTFGVSFGSMVSALMLLFICRKKLKYLTRDYFKIAIPFGLFYTAANLSQKIGLQYTTPTVYSFLENLSCIVVPFLTWWFIKKKPSVVQLIGSVVCLASAFVLSGLGSSGKGFSLGIGEILCALSGIFYGVNIAGTGAFARKFDTGMYIMIQMFMESIVSFLMAIVFHNIQVDGVPMEVIRFSWNPLLFFSRIALILVSNTLCWIIRTSSMKHVDASIVAVMMPFSSIIAGVLSVLAGMDVLSMELVVGALLGLAAMMICALGDILADKKERDRKQVCEENFASEQKSQRE